MAKIKINIYNTNTNVLNELIKQGAVETTENFEEVEVDEDTYNEVMSEQENESENKQEQKVKSKTSTQKNQQEEKPKEERKEENISLDKIDKQILTIDDFLDDFDK